MARGRSCTSQQRHLVISIQVVFVSAVAELHALQELVGDAWISGSGQKRWEPVEPGKDSVLDGAGLYVSGPADDGGNTEPAFENSAFSGAERSHSPIGPSKHFGAVVSGENNNRVVSFADVVEMLKNGPDAVVHLSHASL